MAALSLLMAACSNDDNEVAKQQAEQPDNNMITITAQLAPKSSNAKTRAVTDDGTNIVVDWAVDEHLAILYEVSSTKYAADARVTAVDGSGNATIEFNVEGGTADNTACTIVYPLSAAKDDHSGVKDAVTLLGTQDGTLNANLDVRVGAGTIQTSTPGLDVTTQPAAQFAIWKLTLNQTAKDLYITADGVLIASAIRSSAGTEFYVAVPAVDSKTVAVVANDESNNCYYFSKAGVTIVASKYYQSSPTMTALGTESSADVYKMTGAGTIPDGKTVVLSGVNISDGSITCSGNANIILLGTNTVSAAQNQAAIKIGGSGTTLTITGSGSLTATGGSFCAGIGTDYVNDGTLSGGNIVINGGTVTATGGMTGAGIGTGRASNATNTCGDITINGGTVIAQGGANGGAGIGTGLSVQTSGTASNRCGAITIGTGVKSVTAKKSSSGNAGPNSIGKGRSASGTQACGTITIGGTIYWDGSDYQNGGDTYLTNDITYPTAP